MELTAEKRTQFGKKTKTLRNQRKIPAVVFGKDMDSVAVSVDENAFMKVYEEAGETNLVDLNFVDQHEKVLIKDLQLHPVTSSVVHINFHKVNLKEKISADIPVTVVGEEENELIKSGEALPLLLLSDLTVSALPTDLPDGFEVDVSGLTEIGDGITVSQLKYDRGKIELVDHEDDELVAKLDYAVQEEEPEEEIEEEELLEQLEVTGEALDEEEGEDEGGEEEKPKPEEPAEESKE